MQQNVFKLWNIKSSIFAHEILPSGSGRLRVLKINRAPAICGGAPSSRNWNWSSPYWTLDDDHAHHHGNTLSWLWQVSKLIFNLLNKCISLNICPTRGMPRMANLSISAKFPAEYLGILIQSENQRRLFMWRMEGLRDRPPPLTYHSFLSASEH